MLTQRSPNSVAGVVVSKRQRPWPTRSQAQSGFNLVRWIMVVTLGCSLGLLFIYIVVSTVPLRRGGDTFRIVRRLELKNSSFRISDDELGGELRRVIESQLAAFRQDDYARAYHFAASSLKTQVSLPAFERLVRTSYPVIAKSSAVQFGVILDNGGEAMVNASIVGESGGIRHYQYILERERSGWKIMGVNEVKSIGTVI